MKRLFARMSLLFSAASIAVATVAAVAAPVAPDEVIKTAQGTLQADISQNKAKYQADKPAFYQMVDSRVTQYFDTKYIAQTILAQNYRTATPDQRTRFESAFKKMLINSYADALLQYADSVKAEIQPAKIADGADRATVNTKLIRPDAPPVAVAFDMRQKPAGSDWKVVDIKVENISLVTNFRSQVAAQVKASSLDAVIQKLESGQQVVAPPEGAKP